MREVALHQRLPHRHVFDASIACCFASVSRSERSIRLPAEQHGGPCFDWGFAGVDGPDCRRRALRFSPTPRPATPPHAPDQSAMIRRRLLMTRRFHSYGVARHSRRQPRRRQMSETIICLLGPFTGYIKRCQIWSDVVTIAQIEDARYFRLPHGLSFISIFLRYLLRASKLSGRRNTRPKSVGRRRFQRQRRLRLCTPMMPAWPISQHKGCRTVARLHFGAFYRSSPPAIIYRPRAALHACRGLLHARRHAL